MKASKIILSLSGQRRELDTAHLPSIPANLPTKIGDENVTYAWKVMAAPGEYTHPGTGERFSFTAADFRQMQRTHTELREKQGYHPYIPDHHTLKPDGKSNLGRVIDVIEHDGLLLGLHELIGENAKSIATRNESSIYFEPQHRDQHGKKWPNVIVHNAIIPDPVLTGLGGFVEVHPAAIAASRAADGVGVIRVPVFQLSRSSTMLSAALIALLGLAADANDDAILEGVKTKLATPVKDPALETELTKVKGQLATAEQTIALSRSSQPNPEILAERADRYIDKVDTLVTAGKLTPAQGAPLKAFIRNTDGAPNAVALSRSASGKSVIDQVIELVQIPKAPASGEETGAQDPIELSRSGGSKKTELDQVEANARKRAEAMNKQSN